MRASPPSQNQGRVFMLMCSLARALLTVAACLTVRTGLRVHGAGWEAVHAANAQCKAHWNGCCDSEWFSGHKTVAAQTCTHLASWKKKNHMPTHTTQGHLCSIFTSGLTACSCANAILSQVATDMAQEKLVTPEEAILLVEPR